MMIPGPMEHLKANAIAMVVGAALVLVAQTLSRRLCDDGAAAGESLWERWTIG